MPPAHPEDSSASITEALDAIRAGDGDELARLLDATPELVGAEVQDGTSLLDEGLNLAGCFDRAELVRVLLDAGARADARGTAGITALESAIYHGSRAAADVLADVELVPDVPWVAAGAGRVDRLERFVDGSGGLIAEAYRDRPNPADVGWLKRLPARDAPQDVLDEALVHAAQNERAEAVEWLLERGADPNAGPYQGCGALHLAAAFGAIDSVRLLVAAGADVDRRNDFNRDNALGWAQYALERERPGDPGVIAVIDYLRGLGSRPAVWGS